MKLRTLTYLTSFSFLFSTLTFAGDLTGKVVLNGKPPAESPIDLSADAKCHAAHSTPITTQKYLVGPDGGLANVLVYVKEGASGKKFPIPPPATLDQVGCLYNPYVMGVQVGQTLVIQNSDDTMHNVHSLATKNTKPIGGADNVGQPVKGSKNEAKFDKPEVFVKFKCDVHPWMFAYVGVIDSPYFAVTAADGTFKIPGLPDGDYTIVAAHSKAGESAPVKVKVAGAAPVTADFTFTPK